MKELEIIHNQIDNKKLKKLDLDRFLIKFEDEYEETYLMPDFFEESLKWIKIYSYLLELFEKKYLVFLRMIGKLGILISQNFFEP